MRPAQLRRILLIQAIETADADGAILPPEERREATRESAQSLSPEASGAEQARFVANRAEWLATPLAARFPAVDPLLSPPHRLRFLAPFLLALAAIAGWSSQALGTEKMVNLLSFPLLGIVGWNCLVYLVEVIHALSGRRRNADLGDELPDSPLTRLVERVESLPARFRSDTPDKDIPPVFRVGITNFQRRWRRLVEPITLLRVRGLFHLAAALLAIAAVAGMYAKGAATEYRAYWESTFFGAASLQSFLDFILGPASLVSGIPVPDVAPLQRTAETPQVTGQVAAPWIHLYALTITLIVVIPRLLLAALKVFRAGRREAAIDPRILPGSGLYFERLIAEALGTAIRVGAVSYCHHPSLTAESAIERQLETELDSPVSLDWLPGLSLGEEEEGFRALAGNPDALPAHLVLCFDFATTPEEETHGLLIRSAKRTLGEIDSETRLHVVLDAEGFDDSRKSLPDFADRRAERFQSWRSVGGPVRDGLRVVPPLDA